MSSWQSINGRMKASNLISTSLRTCVCCTSLSMTRLFCLLFVLVVGSQALPQDAQNFDSTNEFLASLVPQDDGQHQIDEKVVNTQPHTQDVHRSEHDDLTEGLTDAELLAALGLGANQGDVKRCEGNEFVCVPYYLCREDAIITDGAGLIDIRFGSKKDGPDESLSHSECPNYIDVCCAAPKEKENITEKYEAKCGTRNQLGINARIVGFEDGESQFGEFPWMAAILRTKEIDGEQKNLYVCGGALIHPQVVLTAAHCVNNLPANVVRVRLGEWDTKHTTEFYPHLDLDVSHIALHPGFNARNLYNDFALLFFSSPVELQPHIDTLCLPDPNENYDWSLCTATGWGKDRFDNGNYQTVLKQVDLMRENSSSCQESLRTTRLGQYFRLHSSFTCAGAPQLIIQNEYGAESVVTKPADTCTGDGGSPLACPSPSDPSRYVHGGIVAWGIGCGQEGIPGVYADPVKALHWIDEIVYKYLNLQFPYWGHYTPSTGGHSSTEYYQSTTPATGYQ